MDERQLRQILNRINGATIWHYTTTFLMLGSMSCFAVAKVQGIAPEVPLSHRNALQQTLIAEFALAQNNIPIAIHNYTVLAIRSDSPALKQRALNIALEYNDLQSALNISQHWVAQEPEDTPALFYLAHIALKAHQYPLAASTLDHILNLDDNADLEQILAGISPESAPDRLVLLDALAKSKERENPSILVLIAGLQAQNGQYENALDTINRALNKRPKNTSYILMKANLLLALQDHAGVEKWYAQARSRNPNNLEIRLAEARFLIKQQQAQTALTLLLELLQKWPDNNEAKFIGGLTSIDLKQYAIAERLLLGLGHSDQYQNDANYYLGINAERQQQFDKAKNYYRLVDGSLYMLSRRNLIAIYEKQKQLGDALQFLTQERVNYPQHASFLYQSQAEILNKLGNRPAAIQLLDEAIQNLTDDPELIYAEVLLLDPFTDRDKLDRRLKQLLKIEPNSPTYLNAYAYTLALQNRRLSEARQYAEMALQYAPEQASILDTLGYIAFLQNDFKAAEKYLGQAYQISNNISIGVRYARSLFVQGKINQFNVLLKQLQQKYPSDPQLKQLDSLILTTSSNASGKPSVKPLNKSSVKSSAQSTSKSSSKTSDRQR